MNCYNFFGHNCSGSLVGTVIQWAKTILFVSGQIARKYVSQQ